MWRALVTLVMVTAAGCASPQLSGLTFGLAAQESAAACFASSQALIHNPASAVLDSRTARLHNNEVTALYRYTDDQGAHSMGEVNCAVNNMGQVTAIDTRGEHAKKGTYDGGYYRRYPSYGDLEYGCCIRPLP